jgi:hypothetical protein
MTHSYMYFGKYDSEPAMYTVLFQTLILIRNIPVLFNHNLELITS